MINRENEEEGQKEEIERSDCGGGKNEKKQSSYGHYMIQISSILSDG
jgi:hypothetical protein